jgi:hypothetical protein
MWTVGNINSMLTMLQEARFALRMKVGPLSVAVDAGRPFEYFESVRSAITSATSEVFFVDRFLEAEFVSRYLALIKQGVGIRLLARDRVKELLPAVDLFSQQEKRAVEVRSSDEIHDRFVFVDQDSCYFSGASFKDGGRNTPSLFAQIIDFRPTLDMYEARWQRAKVER